MKPLWAGALLLSLASAGAAAEVRIDVFHTNDIHGWIMPRPAGFRSKDPQRLVGGCAALASAVRKDAVPHLLLDAGDWWQGAQEGTLTKGVAVVDCMNAAGFDAAEIGNHDFDDGFQGLTALASQMDAPVLAANVYEETTGKRPAFLKAHILKTVAGVKVGIFGLLTTNMPRLTFAKNYAGLRFRKEVDEARDQVRELRALGATVVIVVSHLGFRDSELAAPYDDDQVLASEVPGIDLIVGGHSHTTLRDGVRDPKNGTLIVQTGSFLTAVGKVELAVDAQSGKVLRSTEALVDLWIDETGEAPDVRKALDGYEAAVSRQLDVVIATAADNLARNRAAESTIGDWFTDCEREAQGVDVAFQNSGGIRADLPAGPVTLRRIYEIMPFDNTITTFSLTGAQLLEVLEHGVSGQTSILQVGGLRFTYRPEAERGQRVDQASIGGKPLEKGRRYTVAAADFLVTGGDGYSTFGGAPDKAGGPLLRDVLSRCAREHPLIRAAARDRIVAEEGGR